MGIVSAIQNVFSKAQDSAEKYLRSSIRVIEAGDAATRKQRPFNFDAATKAFSSWVFAAANINATAVAAVPMRLYVRKRAGRKCLFRTSPVPRGRKAYLVGGNTPVARKLLAFGDDFEEVIGDHPLIDLLRKPTPYHSGYESAMLRILYGELTGNAYMHPVLGGVGGTPSELWLMPAQWVWILPSRETFIRGYVYGQSADTRVEFSPDEVIHFKRPNPRSLYYGLGKVEAAWGVTSLNDSYHTMDLAFADNNARPDYAMIVKSGATETALNRFEQKVNQQLRGARNAGQFLTVTGDVTLTPLNFPPKDLGGREDIVEEIAAVFGVPVSLLKANDPNLASAQTGFASWKETTILPLCRMDEEVLNASLLPLYGIEADACLAYDSPVPADDKKMQDRNVAYVGAGIVTRNEARADEGLPPDANAMADALLINGQALGVQAPGTSINIGQQAVPPASAPIVGTGQDVEVAEAAVLNGAQITAATAIVRDVAAGLMPRDAGIGQLKVLFNLEADQAETIMGSAGKGTATTPNINPATEPLPSGSTIPAKAAPGVVHGGDMPAPASLPAIQPVQAGDDARENEDERRMLKLAGGIAGIMARKREHVLALLASVAGKAVKGPVADAVQGLREAVQAGDADMEAVFRGELDRVLYDSGRASLTKYSLPDATWEITNPKIQEYLANYTTKLVGVLDESTFDMISAPLAAGIKEGETIRQLADRLDETGAFGPARSELIARTESANAYCAGEEMAWKESGVVERKKWLLSPDACEFCQAIAAEFSDGVELGGSFAAKGDLLEGVDGGVMPLDYKATERPPLHPNCRCALQPVLKGASNG